MSSTPTIRAVTNGTATEPARRRFHGIRKLRDREAKGLIAIICDALSQAADLAHELHEGVYGPDRAAIADQLQKSLLETLTCMETADHYLRMLSDILDGDTEDTTPDAA